MAAIAYPVRGGQTSAPQLARTARQRPRRQGAGHLRLVEAPLFAEPIFDELKEQARRDEAILAPWSEPKVQLPLHQIVPEFAYSQPTTSHRLASQVQPAIRQASVAVASPSCQLDEQVAIAPVYPVTSQRLQYSVSRYRIRRLVVGIGLCAVMYGVFSGAGALAGTHQGSPRAIAGSVRTIGGFEYTVRPGDTLWSIASRVYPNGDPRPLVAQLSADLGGRSPQPGQHLLLP